jgi:transcriptional regulator with XRE-family HTH domain
MLLGDKIKELREEHGVLQRQLAALLEIDTPMFSKIERGDRYAKRAQVIQLAEYFKIDKNELTLAAMLISPCYYATTTSLKLTSRRTAVNDKRIP